MMMIIGGLRGRWWVERKIVLNKRRRYCHRNRVFRQPISHFHFVKKLEMEIEIKHTRKTISSEKKKVEADAQRDKFHEFLINCAETEY